MTVVAILLKNVSMGCSTAFSVFFLQSESFLMLSHSLTFLISSATVSILDLYLYFLCISSSAELDSLAICGLLMTFFLKLPPGSAWVASFLTVRSSVSLLLCVSVFVLLISLILSVDSTLS